MKKLIYILLGTVVLCSCKNSSEETAQTTHPNIDIKWDDKQTDSLSSITYDVKYIALESHSDGLFDGTELLKIIIKKDKIFVMENRNANALFVFDINGRFLHRVGRVGSGPGEYSMIWSFTVDDKYVYLLDGSAKKIIKYNHSAKYIDDSTISDSPYDFAALDNGDFIFVNNKYHKYNAKYRLRVTDKDFKTKKELFKINEYDSELTMHHYFGEGEDKITYQTYVQDTLVVFDRKNGDYSTVYFDFNKKVPLEKRTMVSFAKDEDYQYLSLYPSIINGKYITGLVGRKTRTTDTEKGTVYATDRSSRLYGNVGASTTYDGYNVSAFVGRYYKAIAEKGYIARAPKELDEFFLADPDNVGLVLYKLRQ